MNVHTAHTLYVIFSFYLTVLIVILPFNSLSIYQSFSYFLTEKHSLSRAYIRTPKLSRIYTQIYFYTYTHKISHFNFRYCTHILSRGYALLVVVVFLLDVGDHISPQLPVLSNICTLTIIRFVPSLTSIYIKFLLGFPSCLSVCFLN